MANDPNLTPLDPEALPPELLEIDHWINADTLEWQRHVPPADPFAHRMRQALLPAARHEEIAGSSEVHMREPSASATPPSTRDASGGTPLTPLRPARRVPVPLAAVAAILVVALLAGIFVTLGQNRAGRGGDAPTTTTSPEATRMPPSVTPTRQSQTLPLTAGSAVTQQPGVPVVAPSDPQVMYEYADNGSGVVLRRSDDGGANWSPITYPIGGDFVSAIELAVNPTDGANIFLRLGLGYATGKKSPCLSDSSGARASLGGSGMVKLNALLPTAGNSVCTDVFVSQDSGGHWSLVRLPIAGSLFQTGVTFTYDATAFQAQGATLYGRVWQLDSNGTQTGDIRIARTQDKGKTWSDAGATLQGLVGHICAYSANATALFAVASTADCWQLDKGTRSLWRSDDHGGQWTHVGDAPAVVAQPTATVMAASGTGSASLLYALPGVFSAAGVGDIQASMDGGQTWGAVSSAGLPGGARPIATATTPLSDGSLVVAFTTSAPAPNSLGGNTGIVSVFAWKPAATAWRRVTPDTSVTGPNVANLYVSTGEPLTITLSVSDDVYSSDPRYTLIPFA